MKKLRKVLKITGISLLSLFVLAILLPIVFKKQIVAKVKAEINHNINAIVDFKDVDISLIRSFPRLSVRLEDMSVTGTNEYSKDTLLSSKSLDAVMNFLSLFKDEMNVYAIELESPRIHALVNKEGKANWDIAKTVSTIDSVATKDTTASNFKMKLNHYAIHNGYIFYEDKTMDMKAEISGLDHEGSGDLTADVFTLSTTTSSEATSFSYGGIPYLANTKATIKSDILIENQAGKYSFKNCELLVNDLKINATGFFQLLNDSSYKMDIGFSSPSTNFKDILSLVPAVYKTDFDKIKTSGKASFNGFVRGIYSPVEMPAYDVNLSVNDGSFQYPDLPNPLKNISFDLKASNPDGQTDHAVIDISKAHLEMDKDAIDFHLLFKNPETVKYVDAAVKGKIDLSQVTKFVKMDAGTKLSGIIWADVFAKGNLSSLQNNAGNFSASGFLDIRDLFYTSKDFPQPIQHSNMKIDIVNSGGVADQTNINISTAHIELGDDPFDFSLELKKPMTSMDFKGKAKGSFTLDHIKQFMALDSGTAISGLVNADLNFAGSKALIDKGAYDQVNINGTASLDNVKYVSKDYPTGITISSSEFAFNPKNISLNNLKGNYLESNFTADGALSNMIGYALNNETLKGNISMSVDKMNLADWMGSSSSTTTTSTEPMAPFAVPANIDVTIHAKAGNVNYDKVDYRNINGTLLLKDETVELQNVQTDALDGQISFNGSYSTLISKSTPAINVSYNIKDIDIQKAFMAFNTVQKLMPVGEFLSGRLSSQFSMKGLLNGELMPDLNSLSGNGNMLLLNGFLKKFAPLDKIASTLNVSQLNEISLKDVKSYIEFSNGKVLVKPFTIKVKDIEMQIGGMHGFDQSLDYVVQLKMPRSYLGSQGNALVYNLISKANEKGIPAKLGETVNLSIKIGGKMSNPTMQTELKEVAGDAAKELQQQATEFAKQKLDTAKQTIKDSVNVVKKEVTTELKKELANQLLGSKDSSNKTNLDSTKKKATETLKNTFKGLLNKKKKNAEPE
ncbi:MAG: AsmA-like C-terminal region-containing protein [Flavisolibacter sp.]